MRPLFLPALAVLALCPVALAQGIARCLTPPRAPGGAGIDNSDCDANNTNPSSAYAPTSVYRIPVVVHVIENSAGQGHLSQAIVQSQIDVLNEDYRARAGTPGASGTDARIEFFLASVDPQGAPTSGVTYTVNDLWFQDVGNYWSALAWDTNRYLNFYTNTAAGALGYVPSLPQAGGLAGTLADRVVIAWHAFGRPALGGAPYDSGRSATHEVGHYLGLYHTFDGGCGSASACYTTGDLICDTDPEASPRFGCPSNATSCATPDPVHNYMDYTDDSCMTGFTPEQVRRMRCTLQSYRPLLASSFAAASATHRNAPGNPDIYGVSEPLLGENLNATAMLLGTGWQSAMLFGFRHAGNVAIAPGATLLVDPASLLLLETGFQGNGLAAAFSVPIPMNPALNGLPISTQMLLIGGNPGFSLTNAWDLVLGR
ncbi:MAG: hypothetical protein Fur0037_24750 [Planctomycetota bacterium]